jgi:hypothetical protein
MVLPLLGPARAWSGSESGMGTAQNHHGTGKLEFSVTQVRV